nr:hypothetical protein [Tanacetum cinerariifolium]
MSPGISTGIAEVAAMSDLMFHKRFMSSYDSSPSPTLPVQKSESEGTEDEGPTAKDEDPVTGDEGLAAGVKGPGVDDESYDLDDESYGLDDVSYDVDDESRGLDEEGRDVEIDVLVLDEEEEAVPEGQQQAALVVGTALSAHLGLGYEALRRRDLALKGDHVYSTFKVGQGFGSTPKPKRSERVATYRLPSPEWTSGSLPISPSPSVVPLPVSSPMISLTIPSHIASYMATLTATIPVDEDHFIEVGAQLELYMSILQDHTQRLDVMPPILFAEIDRDERTAVTFKALWRPMLALEAWAWRVDTRMTDMSWTGYADHRLVYDMLLQQTTLQRELQEMRCCVTVLKQERDRRER